MGGFGCEGNAVGAIDVVFGRVDSDSGVTPCATTSVEDGALVVADGAVHKCTFAPTSAVHWSKLVRHTIA